MRFVLAAALAATALATAAVATPAHAPTTFHGVVVLSNEETTQSGAGLAAAARRTFGPFDTDAVLLGTWQVSTTYASPKAGEAKSNIFGWHVMVDGKVTESGGNRVSTMVSGNGPWSFSTGNGIRRFLPRGETMTIVVDAINAGQLDPDRAQTQARMSLVAISAK